MLADDLNETILENGFESFIIMIVMIYPPET